MMNEFKEFSFLPFALSMKVQGESIYRLHPQNTHPFVSIPVFHPDMLFFLLALML